MDENNKLKMNTQQIKENLIDAINQSDNPVFLMEVSKLIDIDLENEKVIKLKKAQIEELKTAIAQIENGELLTHEEAKKQAEEWLQD
ncbi:MAG: hypothetical protein DRI89_02835 [Bacteroidetes bacterium]|nr:MAG: hypothetical protein DRI89_02835 [Bacteroidota bacterium]